MRRIVGWLDAMPHPPLAIEVAPDRVAAARWSRAGSLDMFAVESLPPGAIVPSAVEINLVNSAAVKAAVSKACHRLRSRDEDVALILPDPVIRVFVQHFEDFPRSAEEAIPMLRWKLKKSVPFEADETVISYMHQAPRETGVDVVTGLAERLPPPDTPAPAARNFIQTVFSGMRSVLFFIRNAKLPPRPVQPRLRLGPVAACFGWSLARSRSLRSCSLW